jgi:hypothetical protein
VEKAKQAATAFQQATNDYSAALQNQYNRRVAIDQAPHPRQAEHPLLYAGYLGSRAAGSAVLPALSQEGRVRGGLEGLHPSITARIVLDAVESPTPILLKTAGPLGAGTMTKDYAFAYRPSLPRSVINVANLCPPTVGGMEHELVEIADLDNPLGYKGNYMIFPLLHSCHLTDYMLSTYEDPDIEKKVIVTGTSGVVVGDT